MINAEHWNAAARQHRRLALGADVDIELSQDQTLKMGEQSFPFYVCRWRTGATRHAVLLRPIVRERQERGFLWFPARTVYEVDSEALMREMRRYVSRSPANAAE